MVAEVAGGGRTIFDGKGMVTGICRVSVVGVEKEGEERGS